MSARTARLGDVCEINPRAPKSIRDDAAVSFLSMSSVSEDGFIDGEQERPAGEVRKGYSFFERGDVLVAKITPCFENGKATRTSSLSNPIGFGSTEFHVLRASNDVLPDYVFHTVWNSSFRELGAKNMTGSAGQKRVPTDFIRRLEIPLPPLDDQRRIAAILDKADALRRKRKRALELLDGLAVGAFSRKFLRERGAEAHKQVALENVAVRITDGAHLTPTYVDEGVPFLRVTDIQSDRIEWAGVKRIPEDEHKLLTRHCRPDQGDVLLSKNGTIGIPKYVDWLEEFSIFVSLCLIKPNEKIIRGRYIASFLKTPSAQQQLRQHSKTGTVTNLHLSEIRKVRIPLPELSEQDEWVRSESAIVYRSRGLKRALTESEDLFASLQHRAFTGQL